MEELDKKIKESDCKPGINYLSVKDDDGTTIIYEVYLKDKKEYKVTGIWYTKKDNLPEYSKVIFDELYNQGLSEDGCWFIALDITNEEESKKLMEYLISVREKSISYTELWEVKNSILKKTNMQ